MKTHLNMLSKIYVNVTLRNKFIIPVIMVMFISFLLLSIYLLRDQRTKHEARLDAKAERITCGILTGKHWKGIVRRFLKMKNSLDLSSSTRFMARRC